MARLTSAPPRYVVALNAAACSRSPSPDERKLMGQAEGLMHCLEDLPALSAFVGARFVKERAIGPLEVWRIRPPAVAGGRHGRGRFEFQRRRLAIAPESRR